VYSTLPKSDSQLQDGFQEETNNDLLDSEIAAAFDAHDCPDAGMEAAAQERAVMLAHEIIHEMKLKQTAHTTNSAQNPLVDHLPTWNDQHLAQDLSQVHLETDLELHESEIAAAEDAHDCPDAGMEAAAEERAVMLAQEYIQEIKKNKGA
jgi:hypothetical protein